MEEGFTAVTADPRGTQIDAEVVKGRRAVVKYAGSRRVEKKGGGSSQKHTFVTRGAGEGGKVFSLWGSADLDAKLRKVRSGAVILLGYVGQKDHPDLPGMKLKEWMVADSGRLSPFTESLKAALANTQADTDVIEHAITAQRNEDAERMRSSDAQREVGGSEEQDDDLPF
jgi:hypothetical protein